MMTAEYTLDDGATMHPKEVRFLYFFILFGSSPVKTNLPQFNARDSMCFFPDLPEGNGFFFYFSCPFRSISPLFLLLLSSFHVYSIP